MRLEWVLKPEELKALNDFLGALDKAGFEYYHDPEVRFMIKIRGKIEGLTTIHGPVYFEQEKFKKINISEEPDYIEIKVFDKKKPILYVVKAPKNWKISYDKGHLYIFY